MTSQSYLRPWVPAARRARRDQYRTSILSAGIRGSFGEVVWGMGPARRASVAGRTACHGVDPVVYHRVDLVVYQVVGVHRKAEQENHTEVVLDSERSWRGSSGCSE